MDATKFVIQIEGHANSGKTSSLLALAMQGATESHMESALVLIDEPFAGLDEDYNERRSNPELAVVVYTHKRYKLVIGLVSAPLSVEQFHAILKQVTIQGNNISNAITKLYLDMNTMDTIAQRDACYSTLKGSAVQLYAYTKSTLVSGADMDFVSLKITATSSTGYL